jgi:transcriptional regulator with XRE-family HTH domain
MRRFFNYLRTHRRRWQLTQDELAFIFGYSDQSIIARLERDERTVTLSVAHACEVLFGVEPDEIVPGLFVAMEEGVVRRMYELAERLGKAEATKRTAIKLELLNGALSRIAAHQEI